jgi:hypothetical protein
MRHVRRAATGADTLVAATVVVGNMRGMRAPVVGDHEAEERAPKERLAVAAHAEAVGRHARLGLKGNMRHG